MKASELRIGNWVMDNSGYVLTDAELLMEISHEVGFVSPIPLTHELLERAGYRIATADFMTWDSKEKFVLYRHISNTSLIKDGEENIYRLTPGDVGVKDVKLLYLHQLQNLFYALTGEELDIDL